uniref:EGF-like domain-containing protein n=2 Tax=Trichogramma kaykai TaxID=54128 RepID=A0ABD2WLH2_9HYME
MEEHQQQQQQQQLQQPQKRHYHRQEQPRGSPAETGLEQEEPTRTCCTRCRAKSHCSCRILGLSEQEREASATSSFHPRGCSDASYSPISSNSNKHNNNKTRLRILDEDRCEPTTNANSTSPERRFCKRQVTRRRPPAATDALALTSTSTSSANSTCRTSSRKTCSYKYSYNSHSAGGAAFGSLSYLATFLLISYGLFGAADACSSRSTPKPRPPPPTPRPNITFHMYTCPPDYAEWYCLNGATCFTVKIVDSLLYNCLCSNGYIGQRCEFKDLDGSYLPSRQRVMLETASIAGAVTIAVFLAVITFISVYIHCKRKQKELQSSTGGVDSVDGISRDPELRPFCSRSRSLMIFMAKNPNSSICPTIEQTRMMNNWNYPMETRLVTVNETGKPSPVLPTPSQQMQHQQQQIQNRPISQSIINKITHLSIEQYRCRFIGKELHSKNMIVFFYVLSLEYY